jgi:ankyrin repeat protein
VGGVQDLFYKIDDHIRTKAKMGFGSCDPIACAAAHGNLPAIRALLEAGVDVNEETIWKNAGYRPLEVAALKGQAAAAKALIEAGADINHRDEQDHETALILAAANGHAAVVAVLLNAGADVNLVCNAELGASKHLVPATALSIAAANGHDACVALLLQAGADIHKTNANGHTPMDLAKREVKRCEGFTPAKKELAKYKYEKVVTLLRQAAAMRR